MCYYVNTMTFGYTRYLLHYLHVSTERRLTFTPEMVSSFHFVVFLPAFSLPVGSWYTLYFLPYIFSHAGSSLRRVGARLPTPGDNNPL